MAKDNDPYGPIPGSNVGTAYRKSDGSWGSRKTTAADRAAAAPKVPKPYRAPAKAAAPKTKTTSAKKSSGGGKRLAATIAKGKPYKGQSSKKAVRKVTKKVTARSGKTGAAATKQARRIVRARKAKK